MPVEISLRPATLHDVSSLTDCFLRSMQNVITAARGEWNPERETEQFLRQLVIDKTEIVEAEEQKLGFVMLDNDEDIIVIHTLCVLPEHQGRGIGSTITGRLCERYAGRAMQLTV